MVKALDLTGMKFGRLLATERAPRPQSNRTTDAFWLCKCDCGRESVVSSYLLRRSTRSCGCLRSTNRKDLTGQRFGDLLVLGRSQPGRWDWSCVCGKLGSSFASVFNKGVKSCGCKKTKPEAAFNDVWNDYQGSARTRGHSFELTKDQFREITSSNCHYCNSVPSTISNRAVSVYIYNGIDRKDNSVGYVFSNCLPCCPRCNRAKHKLGYGEFLELVSRIHAHVVSKCVFGAEVYGA